MVPTEVAVTAVTSQLNGGKTLAQVAQDKGVDSGTVVDTVLAPENEVLQVRVKYGYMTRAQADSVMQTASQRVQQMLTTAYAAATSGGTPTVPGNQGGHGGMMGSGVGGGMMGGSIGGGMMGGGAGTGMMGW